MRARSVWAVVGGLFLAGLLLWITSRDAANPGSDTPALDAPAEAQTGRERVDRGRPPDPGSVTGAGRPSDGAVRAAGTGPPADTNWLARLFSENGDVLPLPPEVIEQWLAAGRTNAADLLALRQAGAGEDYLRLALAHYPNDPRVLLSALGLKDGPEAKRERLDRLKAAEPDNALADYLSARDHFQQGRPEEGLGDLVAATGKSRFDDHVLDAMLTTEELYLQAGRSAAEAKALGTATAHLPHLAQLKGLAQDVAALQTRYIEAGDPGAAEQLAQYGLRLGEQLAAGEGSHTLIGQLVGTAVEAIVLRQLEPDRPYEFLSGTVNEHLAQLDQRRAAARENGRVFHRWMETATEVEVTTYFDRFKVYGESEAMNWVRQRVGQP
jgi:hypothetical protein